MSRYSIDYSGLKNTLEHKTYKYEDVKNRLVKVAFDIVKFKDDDMDKLWQIQSSDDGEYILAMYDEQIKKEASVKNNWTVVIDNAKTNMHIFYKGDPISLVSFAELGVPVSERAFVSEYLPKKLATNKNLVKGLLSKIANSDEILSKYPELS